MSGTSPRSCIFERLIAIRRNDGLTVNAGGLEPVGSHRFADGDQFLLSASGGTLTFIPLCDQFPDEFGVLLLADLPAALFGGGCRLQHHILRRPVEASNAF